MKTKPNLTKHDLAISEFVDDKHFMKLARIEAFEHEDGYICVTQANCIVRVEKSKIKRKYKRKETPSRSSEIVNEALATCWLQGKIISREVLELLIAVVRGEHDEPVPPVVIFPLLKGTPNVSRVDKYELVETVDKAVGIAVSIRGRNYRFDNIEKIVAAARIMEVDEIDFRDWPEQNRALFLFAGIDVLLSSDAERPARVITQILID
jgi:hypothetical protein